MIIITAIVMVPYHHKLDLIIRLFQLLIVATFDILATVAFIKVELSQRR